MSSISISCLPPKPPPIRGFITRMRFTGRPSSGATMRADVERDLCRGPEHEALILVEPADRDVRLDGGVLLLMDMEGLLEDCFGAANAASSSCVGHGLAFDVVADVVGGVVDALGVRLVVNDRRTRRDRLDLVEHRWQDLVGRP